jgi:hypothetical protein
MLSQTALTRPVLRFSPVLSRQSKGKDEHRYKYAGEHGHNEQQIPAFHVQSPANSLHLLGSTGCSGAVQPKPINADSGRYTPGAEVAVICTRRRLHYVMNKSGQVGKRGYDLIDFDRQVSLLIYDLRPYNLAE